MFLKTFSPQISELTTLNSNILKTEFLMHLKTSPTTIWTINIRKPHVLLNMHRCKIKRTFQTLSAVRSTETKHNYPKQIRCIY